MMTTATLRALVAAGALVFATAGSALAADQLTFDRLAPDGSVGESIPVLFNPEKVTINKTVPWEEQAKPGREWPDLPRQPRPRELKMALVYDTSPTGQHVDDLLMPLLLLAERDPATDRPPKLRLVWGAGLRFTGFVKELDVSYELFGSDGVPVRATVNATFIENLPDAGSGLRN